MRRLYVNLEAKEKTYVKNSGVLCPRDGFVVFRQSELLTGRLGKVTLGGSNKSGLFQVCCCSKGCHTRQLLCSWALAHASVP